MSYSSDILADSPLAYWKLDETSGATQFADSSGNLHPATISGTPTYSTAYKVDTGSVQFNGTQYGSVASGAWFGVRSTYSVEVWFSATSTGLRMLVGYDNIIQNPGNPTRVFQFYLSGGQVVFLPLMSSGGYGVAASTATNYNDGIWHHAVGVYDGSMARLYIDGAQVGTAPITGTTTSGGGQPILIGTGFSNTPGNTYQYSGSLDEIAIYGAALSAGQVTTHYNSGLAALASKAQIENVYLETMDYGTANAQIESAYVEVMDYGQVNAVVESSFLYAMDTGSLIVQAEATFLEVLTPVEPVQVETVYAETLVSTTPPSQIEAVYAESLIQTTPPARIETNYLEVLLLPGAVQRFVGWGLQR